MKRGLFLLILIGVTGCSSIPAPDSPDSGILEVFLSNNVLDVNALEAGPFETHGDDLVITLYFRNLETGEGYPVECPGGRGYYLAYNLPSGNYELAKVYASYYYLASEAGEMDMVRGGGITVSRPVDKKVRRGTHKVIYRNTDNTLPLLQVRGHTVLFYGSLEINLMLDPAALETMSDNKPLVIISGSLALLDSREEQFKGALFFVLEQGITEKWKPLRILSRE